MSTNPPRAAALTIKQFLGRYPVGRTKLWEMLRDGEVLARRVGLEPRPDKNGNLIDHRRVLIDFDSAERWYAGLPSNVGGPQ